MKEIILNNASLDPASPEQDRCREQEFLCLVYLVGAQLHPVADLSRRNSLKAEGIQPQSGNVVGKKRVRS